MLLCSQKKGFQITKSTLFLQEISFSSTVFNIHYVYTELTFNLLTEKSFLLRTPKLVIYCANQSHIQKSWKCFLGLEMFISAKNTPTLPASAQDEQNPKSICGTWHNLPPALMTAKVSAQSCAVSLELQDSSEKWQRHITCYISGQITALPSDTTAGQPLSRSRTPLTPRIKIS